MGWLYHSNCLLASQHVVFLCVPGTDLTSKDIGTCFGGFVGLNYDYSESVQIGGKLSGEHCRKYGGGDGSKYLVLGLPEREVGLPLGHKTKGWTLFSSPLIPFQSVVKLHRC